MSDELVRITVRDVLDEFKVTPWVATTSAGSPTQAKQLERSFIDGVRAGVVVAVRALEMATTREDLGEALEVIRTDIDSMAPNLLAAPTLASTPTEGNA